MSKLNYAGPDVLAEQLLIIDLPRTGGKSSALTLDLGCGTGLNGTHLKAVSASLTGVDLSRHMLDLAEQKGVYDQLHKSEICVFLKQSTLQYDLISCMDTLIYFGVLEEIMASMAKCLASGGYLIFTTETLAAGDTATGDCRLNISGRFSHREAYLRRLLQANGFAAPTVRDMTIRMEAGTPIAGQLICALKR